MRATFVAAALFVLSSLSEPAFGAEGSIAAAATQLAKDLGPQALGALIVSTTLRSDTAIREPDKLVERLANTVASRIAGSRVFSQVVPKDRAAKIVSQDGPLIVLESEIVRGEMRVVARVMRVPKNAWDRLRQDGRAILSEAGVRTPIDAEIRSYFPPIVLEQASLKKFALDGEAPLAISCADLDGDGGLEVAIVTSDRVRIGRLSSGKYAVDREVDWAKIGARRPVGSRDPFAAVFVEHESVAVGHSDRGGARLNARLTVMQTFPWIPLSALACAGWSSETNSFEGNARRCEQDGAIHTDIPPHRFDAWATAELSSKTGERLSVTVARDPSGRMRMRAGTQVQAIDNVGAQVTVGDLDLDGSPEIVYSKNSDDDAITIMSWDMSSGTLRERKLWEAKEGTRALAVCPAEQNATPGILAAVGKELWLIR